MKKRRPDIRLDLCHFGAVDPFRLRLEPGPGESDAYTVRDPLGGGPPANVDVAGIGLVGAGQALFDLAIRWMDRAGRALPGPEAELRAAEVRMVLKRREARLLAALLRRHLDRLPEPPGWMPELLSALEQIDEYLRWEEAG